MQPVKNRVAVKVIPTEEQQTTLTGIIIPDTSQIISGEIISVGSEVEGLVPGDIVLFEKGKGVEADGLLVLNEYELLAKQEKPV